MSDRFRVPYRFDSDTCRRIAQNFAWGGTDCNAVLRLFELGAHAWERNTANLRLRRVPDDDPDYSFVVHEGDTSGALAQANMLKIVFSDAECWHGHQDFCRVVAKGRVGWYAVLIATYVLSTAVAIVAMARYCRHGGMHHVVVSCRAAMITLAAVSIFITLRGCECAFFGLVATHEIGHVLGIGHIPEVREAVMHPKYYEHLYNVCPNDDDMRALNASTRGFRDVVSSPTCVDEGPALQPAGFLSLVVALTGLGYIAVERLVVAFVLLRREAPRRLMGAV